MSVPSVPNCESHGQHCAFENCTNDLHNARGGAFSWTLFDKSESPTHILNWLDTIVYPNKEDWPAYICIDKACLVHEFNTEAIEQLNVWMTGFNLILKHMVCKNFKWFLHSMLFYHAKHVLIKIEKQKKAERTKASNNVNELLPLRDLTPSLSDGEEDDEEDGQTTRSEESEEDEEIQETSSKATEETESEEDTLESEELDSEEEEDNEDKESNKFVKISSNVEEVVETGGNWWKVVEKVVATGGNWWQLVEVVETSGFTSLVLIQWNPPESTKIHQKLVTKTGGMLCTVALTRYKGQVLRPEATVMTQLGYLQALLGGQESQKVIAASVVVSA
ncbi:hypothetical protein BJ912DRAFT_920506 [Pholiota molesta]|nr:hypothetical protein BJ912DRAFT_920506 [Pholiota molesta]